MGRRAIDILLAAIALTASAPLLLLAMIAIWLGDGHAPLYLGDRVGRSGRVFRIVKLRTMVPGADGLGGTLTANDDKRITPIGRWLRRLKLDEVPQFWNVLRGEMAIVGPRPNTWRDGVDRYTPEEWRLLSVRPGITGLASIVFCDEGHVLSDAIDPDGFHDAAIRPWKSRLGLLYIDHCSLSDDLRLMILTFVALVTRRTALRCVERIVARWGAEESLRRISGRHEPLPEGLPPRVPA
jgi:lipopolysaccharide/colanic/teichoic acid biosynthesis glycosyltransferase